jgi:tRNA_anti-like
LNNKIGLLKKIIFAVGILAVIGGIIIWYIFTDTYKDTNERKAAYTVNGQDFIKEFQQNDSIANKKYTEKIITVNGIVSEIEPVDSIVNIKMIDTITDAYINFAFQEASVSEAKSLKEGDSVSVKGSCSGGTYSEILETNFITFKRCTLNK